jgi:hypothetical protein
MNTELDRQVIKDAREALEHLENPVSGEYEEKVKIALDLYEGSLKDLSTMRKTNSIKVGDSFVIKDRDYFQFWDGEKFGHFSNAILFKEQDLKDPRALEILSLKGNVVSLEDAIYLYTQEKI